MSVKPCNSPKNIVDLFSTPDATGHQSYSLRPLNGGSSLFGTTITVTNIGRTSEGCAAVVASNTAVCGAASAMLVSSQSVATAGWMLEPSSQPGLYLLGSVVSVRWGGRWSVGRAGGAGGAAGAGGGPWAEGRGMP